MFYKLLVESPLGKLFLISNEKHLLSLSFSPYKNESIKRFKIKEFTKTPSPILLKTKKQLKEYFQGKRKKFDIPIKFLDGSPFMQKAWKTLLKASYGHTISYKAQAKLMGRPKAIRAVGTANGKNPISIILPCHRIITSQKTLGGYSSGLKRKKFLLRLENKENVFKE